MNLENRLEALEHNSYKGRIFVVWGDTKAELELKIATMDLPKDRQIVGVCWLDPVSPEQERRAGHAKS